jgi:hypothetical protein
VYLSGGAAEKISLSKICFVPFPIINPGRVEISTRIEEKKYSGRENLMTKMSF